jgi:hypothetical protein
MATVEKLSVALSTEMPEHLRKAWHEAVADDSKGLDPDTVFELLEKKYEGLAKATGR